MCYITSRTKEINKQPGFIPFIIIDLFIYIIRTIKLVCISKRFYCMEGECIMLMPGIFDNNFVDHFFDDVFTMPSGYQKMENTVMRTDIREVGEDYELAMELPGYSKEEIQAELKDGILTIAAEHKEETEDKDEKGKFIRRERYTGKCKRSFQVGKYITQEDIHAAFKDGVLTLRFPKEKKPVVEEKKYIAIQ